MGLLGAGKLRHIVAVAAFVCSAADLAEELYREATRSQHMRALKLADIDEFTGANRPEANVMIFLHEGSCHICRDALPKLMDAAKDLKEEGVPVEVAHLDCTNQQVASEAKRRFAVKGFPSLLFWRKLASEEDPASLVGQKLSVASDEGRLRRACRAARMAEAKDAQRLQALGSMGEVIEVDRQDMTAKLLVPNVGRIWLPLEVLQDSEGVALPHHRTEAAFHCDASLFGGWRKEAMQAFAQRMSRPAVARLDSLDVLRKEMQEEEHPAMIFCGDELPPAFVELADMRQDISRSFHATDEAACPVPGLPQVVIYAPPRQQWPQGMRDVAWIKSSERKAAAVVASGSEVAADTDALYQWVQAHRFVGITLLGYNNFFAFVKSHPRVLVVAVDMQDAELNPRVLKRLLDVTDFTAVKGRKGIHEFVGDTNDTDYRVGVIDGSLSGLETYGVSQQQLPHMFIMEGADTWVEDADELRVWELPSNLDRVPAMWRSTRGFGGYLKWFAIQLFKSYSFYADFCQQLGGPFGRLAFQAVFLVWMPGTCVLGVLRMVRLLVVELLGSSSTKED